MVHLGSRFLRVGRATDVNPVSVPNVIARKLRPPIPAPSFLQSITRPLKGRGILQNLRTTGDDEYAVSSGSGDPVCRDDQQTEHRPN